MTQEATAADLEHELEITRDGLSEAQSQLAKLRADQQAAKQELESVASTRRELQELEVAYDHLKASMSERNMSTVQGSREQLSRLADIESSQDALVAVADQRVEQLQAQHKHELDQLRGFLADSRSQLKDVNAQLLESEEVRGRLSLGGASRDTSLLAEVTSESVLQQEMAEELQSCQERNSALLRELGTLSKAVHEMKDAQVEDAQAIAAAEQDKLQLRRQLAENNASNDELRLNETRLMSEITQQERDTERLKAAARAAEEHEIDREQWEAASARASSRIALAEGELAAARAGSEERANDLQGIKLKLRGQKERHALDKSELEAALARAKAELNEKNSMLEEELGSVQEKLWATQSEMSMLADRESARVAELEISQSKERAAANASKAAAYQLADREAALNETQQLLEQAVQVVSGDGEFEAAAVELSETDPTGLVAQCVRLRDEMLAARRAAANAESARHEATVKLAEVRKLYAKSAQRVSDLRKEMQLSKEDRIADDDRLTKFKDELSSTNIALGQLEDANEALVSELELARQRLANRSEQGENMIDASEAAVQQLEAAIRKLIGDNGGLAAERDELASKLMEYDQVAQELGDVTFDPDPALEARVHELEQSLGETHAKLRQTQAQLRFDAMRTDEDDRNNRSNNTTPGYHF